MFFVHFDQIQAFVVREKFIEQPMSKCDNRVTVIISNDGDESEGRQRNQVRAGALLDTTTMLFAGTNRNRWHTAVATVRIRYRYPELFRLDRV